MIERESKIYIRNELQSIVVVKYKHSLISGRNRGNEENYIIGLVKESRTSYLRMSWRAL